MPRPQSICATAATVGMRVLGEAQDPSNPLLERVKFLAIASTNLDEFFEIRVAGIMEMVDAGLQGESHDGLKAPEELECVRKEAHEFAAAMHATWREQLPRGVGNAPCRSQ